MKLTCLSVSLIWSLTLTGQVSSEDRISEPFTHQNLSLFLVRAEKADSNGRGRTYLTLKDAMDQKRVRVIETKKVNELAVENVSGEEVFIQSGDIVKGGQQDRVISNDFVLPPKSGRIAVDAFCVEQGRWSQRGAESPSTFNSSSEMVATKPLKMAVSVKKNQTEVWNKVAETQASLARSTAQTVSVSASASSLPLTLQSRPIEDAVKDYTRALQRITDGRRDLIGLVFAVNGEINSADIYSSPELFAAMWPKLLKASAVEAVRLKGKEAVAAVPAADVVAFLQAAEKGDETKLDVDRRITLVRRESQQQVAMESRDPQGWIHRSIIRK